MAMNKNKLFVSALLMQLISERFWFYGGLAKKVKMVNS